MNGKIILIIVVVVIISVLAALFLTGLLPPGGGKEKSYPPVGGGEDKTLKPKPKPPDHKPSSQKLTTGEVVFTSDGEEVKALIFVPSNWNGKCIIFVHGLGSSKEKWLQENVVEDFQKYGYCCFLFDLPFHGERGKMDTLEKLPVVIEKGSRDIINAASFLKENGASEVYLVSRSLGSIVSAVALGNGADIEKAELLLASANFSYIYYNSILTKDPKARSQLDPWIHSDIVKQIDPLYTLPNYKGEIHFHCGTKDPLLPPASCQAAFDASVNAKERELFWHNLGHSMPKEEYFDEALEFFEGGASSEIGGSPEVGEPPINVLFVLHFDPPGRDFEVEGKECLNVYTTSRDELVWLLDFADRTGVKMTALFNGYYMQLALRRNELEPIERLVREGHEIGTHAHSICYDKKEDKWFKCPDAPDTWFRDAKVAIDTVLKEIGAQGNRAMCAMFGREEYELEDDLMKKYGYDIGIGNRPEIALNYFGHIVWNPWRARCSNLKGHALEEDKSVGFVSIDHRAQIGSTTSHGGVDSRSDTLKRQFLMLYVEWKYREIRNYEDKVWTWGVVHHPNYGDRYNDHIEDFFSWLNKYFINKRTPSGNLIAVYSTASEVADQYYEWEKRHPGSSSFNYVEGNPYPYICEYSKNKLLNSEYIGEVNLGADIVAFKFRSKDGKIFLLAWYNGKGTKTVDVSSIFSGTVYVITPIGEKNERNPSQVLLTEEPVFIEEVSVRSTFTSPELILLNIVLALAVLLKRV